MTFPSKARNLIMMLILCMPLVTRGFSWQGKEKESLTQQLDSLFVLMIKHMEKTYSKSTLGLTETRQYYESSYNIIKRSPLSTCNHPYNLYTLCYNRIKLLPFSQWLTLGAREMIQLLEKIEDQMIQIENRELNQQTLQLYRSIHQMNKGPISSLKSISQFSEQQIPQRISYLYGLVTNTQIKKEESVGKTICELYSLYQEGVIICDHMKVTSTSHRKQKRLGETGS